MSRLMSAFDPKRTCKNVCVRRLQGGRSRLLSHRHRALLPRRNVTSNRHPDKFAQRARIFKKHKQPAGLMASLKESFLSIGCLRTPRRSSLAASSQSYQSAAGRIVQRISCQITQRQHSSVAPGNASGRVL